MMKTPKKKPSTLDKAAGLGKPTEANPDPKANKRFVDDDDDDDFDGNIDDLSGVDDFDSFDDDDDF